MQWRLTSFLSVAFVPWVLTTSCCSVTVHNQKKTIKGGGDKNPPPYFKSNQIKI